MSHLGTKLRRKGPARVRLYVGPDKTEGPVSWGRGGKGRNGDDGAPGVAWKGVRGVEGEK